MDIYFIMNNKSFTYAEYAIEKHFSGNFGFVSHVNVGLDSETGYYISDYFFPKIGKHIITKVLKCIIHSCRLSEYQSVRFEHEMEQLK